MTFGVQGERVWTHGTMPPDMLLVGMGGWLLWFFETENNQMRFSFFQGKHARLEHFQSWERRFFLAVFIPGLWFAHAAMLLSWSRACAESVHLPISDFGAQKWNLGVSSFETYHRHTAKGCKRWYSFKNTAYPLNEYIPVKYPEWYLDISHNITMYYIRYPMWYAMCDLIGCDRSLLVKTAMNWACHPYSDTAKTIHRWLVASPLY